MATSNTFYPQGGPLAGVNLANTSTTAEFPVGTTVQGNANSSWEYVQAMVDIAQYNAVCINGSGGARPATTTHVATMKKIGFAQVAITSGSFGWVARQGAGFTVMVAASCLANVALYTTATAGTLDDAVVTAGAIPGVVAIVAGSAGGVANVAALAAQPTISAAVAPG